MEDDTELAHMRWAPSSSDSLVVYYCSVNTAVDSVILVEVHDTLDLLMVGNPDLVGIDWEWAPKALCKYDLPEVGNSSAQADTVVAQSLGVADD